jgi:hypothetical protein
MVFGPARRASGIYIVPRALGALLLLLVVALLGGCGSSKPPSTVVTGSLANCVHKGNTYTCSCAPLPTGSQQRS